MSEPQQDLQAIARDLRARVLSGVELTEAEQASALAAIRQGRRTAAASAGTKKSSGSAAPRSAADLLGALGVTTTNKQ